ncbi:MAG: DUF2807 domain-containing protein [Pseudonocardiales bacterium]|nr:DUF2807 domain-containing protein [Pseudonocardiales bacterium]
MAAATLVAGCMGTSTDRDSGNQAVSVSDNGFSVSGSGADGSDAGNYSYSSSDPSGVTGSGKLTTRTIDLSGVTSVVAGADFTVHLKTGGAQQAKVTMDDNLVDRVEATVSGHELRLGLKPGSNVRNATLRAEVTVNHLNRLAANGASHATLDSTVTGPALQLGVKGASQITGPVGVDRFNASESGASVLTLSGSAGSMHLESVGTSQLHGSELAVGDLDAVLSGVSQATVTVNNTLAVTADGVSVLRYRGNPTITREETSGVSSVVGDAS